MIARHTHALFRHAAAMRRSPQALLALLLLGHCSDSETASPRSAVPEAPVPLITPAPNTDTPSSGQGDSTPVPVDDAGVGVPHEGGAVAVCPQGFATRVVSMNYGPSATFGQVGFPQIVLGPPNGAGDLLGSLDVLSLGVGGAIVLGFANDGIANGDGPDFIVFENPFLIAGDPTNPYAELAEVSVSDDGTNWITFPCHSQGFPFEGCAGWHPVFSALGNGVSPFDATVSGGDAFDLETIGQDHARYVRIRDLSTQGGPPAAGFDLDAVSVVHPSCSAP